MKTGNREAIDVALLRTLNNVSVWNAQGKNWTPYAIATPGTRHPYNVQQTPPGNQPTFYLCKVAEGVEQRQAIGLPHYVLHYRMVFFFKIDPTAPTAPATAANALLDAVDALLTSTPPGERVTLGSLGVNNVWVEGTTWIVGGISDQQMAVEVPIKVETGM